MSQSKILMAIFLMTASLLLHAQIRISGFVKDIQTQELMVGAHVIEQNTHNATVTNNNGYFSIILPLNSTVEFSFVGFKPTILTLKLRNDSLITVYLEPGTELEEVMVKAQKTYIPNTIHLSRIEMINTPSIGSTPDVLKTLQLHAGVQSQNEGSSLLLVRGGNPGENLYLLDNVPLIYVNHLGGFISVFNPEIINDVVLYKGAFPPKYGSKLSSVVDIVQKEGTPEKLRGSFEIGVTGGTLALEGPLGLRNSSFILTGRKTFVDLLYLGITSILDDSYKVFYGFHDLNAKFSWKPDAKNSLHLNLYQGDDYLNFWSTTKSNEISERSSHGNIWGNWMISVRYNHVWSSRIFNSNSLSYTRYRLKDVTKYKINSPDDSHISSIIYFSSVQDFSFRSAWQYRPIKFWSMDFGLQTAFLIHKPNLFESDNSTPIGEVTIYTLENAAYLDNLLTIFNKLKANIGVRTVSYAAEKFLDFVFEPRISLNIEVSKEHSINLNYMQVNQYSHLIFTSQTFLNNEIWVPADTDIPPAWSEQYSTGWTGYFRNQKFKTEVELYYKKLDDLSTYREGYTSLMGDENWKTKIETGGKGIAYGAEFGIYKNYGKWTGFLNYTYSHSIRQYMEINQGEEYLFEYDRPNCLSLGMIYPINDHITFSTNWIYQTGLPYTPAIGRYLVPTDLYYENGDPFYAEELIYGERNSQRMRDYHRMDIALNYTRLTKKRKFKSTWTFSIYNLYNRQNPYYYYYNTDNTGEINPPSPYDAFKPLSMYQVSYFSIIPSIAYKVYFESSSSNKDKRSEREKEKSSKFKDWLYQKE